jgi:hypothetical protein
MPRTIIVVGEAYYLRSSIGCCEPKELEGDLRKKNPAGRATHPQAFFPAAGNDLRAERFATAPETLLRSIGAFVWVRPFKPLIFFDRDISPGPTTHFRRLRRFPVAVEKGAELAGFRAGARSLQLVNLLSRPVSVLLSLWPQIRFPGNGDRCRQRLGSNRSVSSRVKKLFRGR